MSDIDGCKRIYSHLFLMVLYLLCMFVFSFINVPINIIIISNNKNDYYNSKNKGNNNNNWCNYLQ